MGLIDPTAVDADMKVVPSIAVVERYDSNVFLAPQSSVPNQTRWDVVTTVAPEVKVQHADESMVGELSVRGTGNAYVNNPGLNFFATNTGLNLNLDNLVKRLIGRVRLQVVDYFQYTPQPPAFLTPKAVSPADVQLIGIQTFRANSLSNVGRATGFYDISPTLSVQGSYQNSLYHFGQKFVTTGPTVLFNATTQTASAGPQIKLSPRDTASLSYTYSTTQYTGAPGFETHNISPEYTRNLTPALTATMNAGVTQLEPAGSRHVVGKASLNWRVSEDERWMIIYNRQVAPAVFLTASALLSQAVSAGMVHQFTGRLSMTANANYAHNATTSAPQFRFDSYSTGLGFSYAITRFISAQLGYDYTHFKYTGGIQFDRNVVGFSINSTWP